jgi:molybdopterin-guanine dinucleotide biosynthesis protein B
MMKVAGVIGYSDAGKTSVVEDLIRHLKDKGHSVSSAKHCTHEINPDKDTERHFAMGAEKVVGVDPNLYHILQVKGNLFRELLGCDYAVLEGFKKERGFLKVLIAQEADDLKLIDDYTFLVTGNEDLKEDAVKKGMVFIEDSEELYDKVEASAFRRLPDSNCKRCGRRKCSDLAREIFEGGAKDDECVYLTDRVLLEVDGKAITLSPFVQEVVDRTIRGLVSSLKDADGKEIKLELR